jgi:hypothetical protein
MALDGRTGRIVLEQVTQRFALPREVREFTAVQDVSFDVDGGVFTAFLKQGKGYALIDMFTSKGTLDAMAGDPALYAQSFEHAREAFPPDSLVSRDGVARVIETMRAFDAVPAGMKIEPESVFDNRYVLKALGR